MVGCFDRNNYEHIDRLDEIVLIKLGGNKKHGHF